MRHRSILFLTAGVALAAACGNSVVQQNTTTTSAAGGHGGQPSGTGGHTSGTGAVPTDATGVTSSSGGTSCSSPANCPPAPPCVAATCDQGTCGSISLAAGTACAEGFCDGKGACVECLSSGDCPAGAECSNNVCVTPCSNGLQDGDETDVDCGGSCAPCDLQQGCVIGADCKTGICLEGLCAELLLISEVRTSGPSGDGFGDDFVELFNPGLTPVTLDQTWQLWARSAQATCQAKVQRYQGKGQVIPPHGHLLLHGIDYQGPAADDLFTNVDPTQSIADAGALWIEHGGKRVESLCYYYDAATLGRLTGGCPIPYECAGAPVNNLPHNGSAAPTSAVDVSLARKPGASGGLQSTGDNAADFASTTPSAPESLASPPLP